MDCLTRKPIFTKYSSILIILLLCSCTYHGKNDEEIKEIYLRKTPIGSSMDHVLNILKIESKTITSVGKNKPCRQFNYRKNSFEEISEHSLEAQLGMRLTSGLPEYIFATWCFDAEKKLTFFGVRTMMDGP